MDSAPVRSREGVLTGYYVISIKKAAVEGYKAWM